MFFDGRLTEAALVVAKRARDLKIPVLVEGERLRASLNDLLALGDIIVTSKTFPSEFTGLEEQAQAIAETFSRHPLAKMMITTLGSKGSVMLVRAEGDEESVEPPSGLADALAELERWLAPPVNALGDQDEVDGITRRGVKVMRGSTVSSSKASVVLPGGLKCWVIRSAAASLYCDNCNLSRGQEDDTLIVDTTGAGDAFIGAVVYSLSKMNDILSASELIEKGGRVLELGGVVAAMKCTEVGARSGLPYLNLIATGATELGCGTSFESDQVLQNVI